MELLELDCKRSPLVLFAKSRPQLIKDFAALLTLVFQQQTPIHFKMHFLGEPVSQFSQI